MERDHSIESLLELRTQIENIFFKQFLDKHHMDPDLKETTIRTMMILYFNGPSTMRYVSDFLSLEKGSFTPVARKLVKLGYIEKKRDQADKRVFYLTLTPKGREYALLTCGNHQEYVNELLGDLSEIERHTLFDAVDIVNNICRRISE